MHTTIPLNAFTDYYKNEHTNQILKDQGIWLPQDLTKCIELNKNCRSKA